MNFENIKIGGKMPKNDASETKPEILMIAYLCIKNEEGLNKQVEILDRFGLNDSQIAQICGAVIQSVRNARVRYKKAQQIDKSKTKGAIGDGI